MFLISAQFVLALLSLAVVAYFDWKNNHWVPKAIAIALAGLNGMLWAVVATISPGSVIVVAVIGAFFFVAVKFTGFFKIQQIRPFDQGVVFLSMLLLPFVGLFALVFQQVIMVALAKARGHAKEVAMMPIYAVSFLLAGLMLSFVIGFGYVFL